MREKYGNWENYGGYYNFERGETSKMEWRGNQEKRMKEKLEDEEMETKLRDN